VGAVFFVRIFCGPNGRRLALAMKHTKQKSRNGDIRLIQTLNKMRSHRRCGKSAGPRRQPVCIGGRKLTNDSKEMHMKEEKAQRKTLTGWIATAAFVAATLQGSRLPEEVATAAQQVAQATATVSYRMGSGCDQDDYPPLPDRAYA
jgi:hypothetical protein